MVSRVVKLLLPAASVKVTLSLPIFFYCVSMGSMEGISVGLGGLSISHLSFADDSSIFSKATVEECDSLQHVLNVYEHSSS